MATFLLNDLISESRKEKNLGFEMTMTVHKTKSETRYIQIETDHPSITIIG